MKKAKAFIKRLDSIATEMFGEFGYDTCSHDEKAKVMEAALAEQDAAAKGK